MAPGARRHGCIRPALTTVAVVALVAAMGRVAQGQVPTDAPTAAPTPAPTAPTGEPTPAPVASASPTSASPTFAPTAAPTSLPPTLFPTLPSLAPTSPPPPIAPPAPTLPPTARPTEAPTTASTDGSGDDGGGGGGGGGGSAVIILVVVLVLVGVVGVFFICKFCGGKKEPQGREGSSKEELDRYRAESMRPFEHTNPLQANRSLVEATEAGLSSLPGSRHGSTRSQRSGAGSRPGSVRAVGAGVTVTQHVNPGFNGGADPRPDFLDSNDAYGESTVDEPAYVNEKESPQRSSAEPGAVIYDAAVQSEGAPSTSSAAAAADDDAQYAAPKKVKSKGAAQQPAAAHASQAQPAPVDYFSAELARPSPSASSASGGANGGESDVFAEDQYAAPETAVSKRPGKKRTSSSSSSAGDRSSMIVGDDEPTYEDAQVAMNSMLDNSAVGDIYANAGAITKSVVVEPGRVVLGDVLDSGQFGEVMTGVFKGGREGGQDLRVAVKKIKGGSIPSAHLLAFEAEMSMMAQLSHPNVLSLLAVVPDPLMIVMELVSERSVKSYIHDRGYSHTNPIPWPTLLVFAEQSAQGLRYLTDHGVIHRDIAARNMLLHVNSLTDFAIKVADFGLSKVVAQQVYMAQSADATLPIPTRWTSLEALYKGKWSAKSDVWSWAVMVWELTTHCQFPYTLLFDDRRNVELVRKGLRLHQAALVPNELYALLDQCWLKNTLRRPEFRDVVARLGDLTKGLTRRDRGVVVPADLAAYEAVPADAIEAELKRAAGKAAKAARPVMQFTLPAAPVFTPAPKDAASSSELYYEVPSEGEDPCYVQVDSPFVGNLKAAGHRVVRRAVEPARVVILPIGPTDLLPKTVAYVRRRAASKSPERVLYALPPGARKADSLPRRRSVFAKPATPKPSITTLAEKAAAGGDGSYANAAADGTRYKNAQVLPLDAGTVAAMEHWLRRDLSREDAEKTVTQHPQGTFLIRKSATAAAGTIFVMTMHLGDPTGACKHYRLPSKGDDLSSPIEMLDTVNGNKSFNNAFELVQYYQSLPPLQKRSLPCRLRGPVPVPQ